MIDTTLIAGLLIGFAGGLTAGIITGAWRERRRAAAIAEQAAAEHFCAVQEDFYFMRDQEPALLRRQAE